MIKFIVFDYDGVIEDTYQLNFDLFQKQFTGLTREEHKRLYDGNLHEEKTKLKERDTGFDVPGEMDEARKRLVIKPGIRRELIRLSKEFHLGIISSGLSSGINEYLRENKVEVFLFVYGAEVHKSKIEKFRILITQYNLRLEEIVFVSDTLGDILEASKIGIRTIAVDFGYHERERLAKGNPYCIVSRFEDIYDVVKGM